MKRFFSITIIGIAIAALFSCNKENSQEKLRKLELDRLDEFIIREYPESLSKPSGLYYIEEFEGTGDTIIFPGDRVQIFYSYWVNNGSDSTFIEETYGFMEGFRLEPVQFTVFIANQLSSSSATTIIQTPGLHEAITYMREGTIANLVLPSEIAFGTSGSGNYAVSGFSTILMRLEVHKVIPAN